MVQHSSALGVSIVSLWVANGVEALEARGFIQVGFAEIEASWLRHGDHLTMGGYRSRRVMMIVAKVLVVAVMMMMMMMMMMMTTTMMMLTTTTTTTTI